MRVALIADSGWLDEDLSLLRLLGVGLLDEGVQAVRVLPEGNWDRGHQPFGKQINWRDTNWSYLRDRRLVRLAGSLADADVDLIHAMGGSVWRGAIELGARLNVPVVLGASGADEVPDSDLQLGSLDRRWMAITATTRPLAEAIRGRVSEDLAVEVIAPGVHVTTNPDRGSAQEGALSAVVSGCGPHDAEYEALFEALRGVTRQYPDSQFFFEGTGEGQQTLWHAAKRHGLLAHVSMVPRRPGPEELLLRADMVIQPQALGRSRRLTLQAMASGTPVLALADNWLDYLIHDVTARVVPQPESGLWFKEVERMIQDASRGRELASSASAWVGRHHLASDQIGLTLALYRRLAGESLKFPKG